MLQPRGPRRKSLPWKDKTRIKIIFMYSSTSTNRSPAVISGKSTQNTLSICSWDISSSASCYYYSVQSGGASSQSVYLQNDMPATFHVRQQQNTGHLPCLLLPFYCSSLKIHHFDLYQILWTYLVHNVIIYQTGTEENSLPEDEWDNKVQRWVDKIEMKHSLSENSFTDLP